MHLLLLLINTMRYYSVRGYIETRSLLNSVTSSSMLGFYDDYTSTILYSANQFPSLSSLRAVFMRCKINHRPKDGNLDPIPTQHFDYPFSYFYAIDP